MDDSIGRIHSILLAIDGSDHSWAATQFVHDFQWGADTVITIVTVMLPRNASNYAALEAMLARAGDMLSDVECAVETKLITGYPSHELLEYAEINHPDLIVLGAKGLRGTLGILLGSVAQTLVEHAICPVLLIRAPYQGLHKTLLAVDGSPECQEAALYLAKFPLPAEVEVYLMHVLPPIGLPPNWAQAWPLEMESARQAQIREVELTEARQGEDEERAGQEMLAKMERYYLSAHSGKVDLKSVLVRGDAATELIEYARVNEIDLIVAGSRGLGPVESLLLGSVSRKLVHYADRSTMIVRSMGG